MKSDRTGELQYAALPWRRNDRGEVEILLITSRETHRWVIPKGWPMEGFTPAQAAATEAFEEAGIRGPTKDSVGAYPYFKRLKDEAIRELMVEVFPMRVDSELVYWPEAQQRRRRWFSIEGAAKAVAEPELAEIIRGFEP